MATFPWAAWTKTLVDFGTNLDGVVDAGISGASAIFDNSAAGVRSNIAVFQIEFPAFTTSGDSYVTLFGRRSFDGTVFEPVPVATGTQRNPRMAKILLPVDAAAKNVISIPFPLVPAQYEFYLANFSGGTFPAGIVTNIVHGTMESV